MLGYLFAMFSHMLHIILGIGAPQNFPPPLDAEKEAECFMRMAHGDEKARDMLIVHNLRLVAHVVRKYYSGNENQEDLVSIGTIGLVKAVDSFKPGNGTKFATYAAKCIQNEILMHFRAAKKQPNDISINETIDIDKEGNPLTYIDVICVDDNFTDEIDRKTDTEQAMRYVNSILTPRERQIIILRYGLFGISPLTQREVALKLGISRSYVSRIEKCALEKLLKALGG